MTGLTPHLGLRDGYRRYKIMPRKRKTYLVKSKAIAVAACRKLETPEQRALRLEKERIKAAFRRASENEEQRAARLALNRDRARTRRANLSSTARLFHVNQIIKSSTTDVSCEVTNVCSPQDRHAYKVFLAVQAKREADIRKSAARRSQESPEQRAARLEKDRIRTAFVRSCESKEAREIRLARDRMRVNAARRLKRQGFIHKKFSQINPTQNELSNMQDVRNKFRQIYKQNIISNHVWDITRDAHQQIGQQHLPYQACLVIDMQHQRNFRSYLPCLGSQSQKCNKNSSPVDGVNVDCEVMTEGERNSDSEHVREVMFETVDCDPFGVKQENASENESSENLCEEFKARQLFQPHGERFPSPSHNATQHEDPISTPLEIKLEPLPEFSQEAEEEDFEISGLNS